MKNFMVRSSHICKVKKQLEIERNRNFIVGNPLENAIVGETDNPSIITMSHIVTIINENKLKESDYKLVESVFEIESQRILSRDTAHEYICTPRGSVSLSALKQSGTDAFIQARKRPKIRLAVFDMDSTLIQQECIDEIARICKVGEFVAEITEQAMRGELDFEQALRKRVALLEGAPADVIEQVKKIITFTPGTVDLCKQLKKLGVTLAVVSGGFIPLAEHVQQQLGLDYAYANTLGVHKGMLSGTLEGEIVDSQRKLEVMTELMQKHHVTKDEVLAVGDGANDIPMLVNAGVGIAFNAKPCVQEQAQFSLNQPSLKNVLYVLGFSDQDLK